MTGSADKGGKINSDGTKAITILDRLRLLLRWLCRCLFRFSLLLLVIVALCLAAGRTLTPLLGSQKGLIEAELSQLLGTQVSIGAISGAWFHYSPVIVLENLHIPFTDTGAGAGRAGSHLLKHLELQLDVPQSLWRRDWVIGKVGIRELNLTLVENARGGWSLAGFVGGGPDYTERFLDVVLNTSELALRNTGITLETAGGGRMRFEQATLELRNGTDLHELQLQANLAGQSKPLRLSLEIDGDPRTEFSALAHLNLELAAFSDFNVLHSFETLQVAALDGGAEMWLSADQNGIRQVQGRFDKVDALLKSTQSAGSNEIGAAQWKLSAQQTETDHWQVWIEDLAFDRGSRHWQPSDIFLELNTGGEALALEASLEDIDLSIVSAMLLASGTLPERADSILRDLNPDGRLTHARISTDFSGNYPGGFNLSGNLQDVGVDAWRSAPAVSGINGYIQADGDSGLVELDSNDFYIHLPRLFEHGWHYDHANTRIHWRLEDGEFKARSTMMDVSNARMHARLQFDLANRSDEQGEIVSELAVLLGVLDADALAVKDDYLPTIASLEGTVNWLDTAILSGQIKNSGLIFRGTLGKNIPPDYKTIQSFYQLQDTDLKFLPDWPRLEALNGQVRIDDNKADAWIADGNTSGIKLSSAQIGIRPREDALPGSWLEITGGSRVEAGQGLDFLRNTPLHNTIGDYIDSWQAAGLLDVNAHLRMPLGMTDQTALVEVSVASESSQLTIPDYGLAFENLAGRMDYSTVAGLHAENLRATLFGYPISADILTFSRTVPGSVLTETGTRIYSRGRTSKTLLADWSKQTDFVRKLLSYTEGEVDYEADLQIFSAPATGPRPSRLTLNSDLRGLMVKLPEPFTKTDEESRDLQVVIDFMAGRGQVVTRYGDNFYAQLYLNEQGLDRGQVRFGPLNRDFAFRQSSSDDPGILISGELADFDVRGWQKVGEDFIVTTENGSEEDNLRNLLRLADVNFDRLQFFGQELHDINVQLKPSRAGWNVYLLNDQIKGTFDFPDDAREPDLIALDYLRLPQTGEAATDTETGSTETESTETESTETESTETE
ncbi:MAG: DUF3971 domain-containing protein, partial [Pseudomonadales bacterium]|nr:DUF3971 domain-containing protein [Pseudomonadales bacterium]